MAKISDIDAKLGEFDASYSSTVSVSVDDRLKNVKITKAILPLSIKALNIQNGEGIKVNYSYYDGDTRLGGWDNVDYISGVGQGDKIYLNFTDEFQNAINSKATKIVLQFVPDEIVEQYPFVEFEQNERLDVQYITLNTFQANGVSQKVDLGIAGEGKVDLATGALSLITPIAKSTSNSLPFSLSINFNSNSISGKKWNLNFEQKLICEEKDQSLIFRYIDGEGQERLFDETFYYDDGSGEKQISRLDDNENFGMFVEPDGTLKYKNESGEVFDVKTKLETSTNLRLVSSANDLPGGSLVDFEPEDLINLRKQRKQYEEYIEEAKNAIDLNKKQLCSYALTKKVAQKQLLEQEDNVKKNNKLFELQKKIEDIKYRALIKNRCYRLTLSDANDASADNTDAKNALGTAKFTLDQINTLSADTDFNNAQIVEGTILANESSLIYEFGIDEYTGSLEIQAKTNEMNDALYCEEITLEDFKKSIKPTLDECGYGDAVDLEDLYERFKFNLALENAKDENLEEEELAQIEATTSKRLILGYKDLVSIDVQIESIVSNLKTYEKRLEQYTDELEKVKFQENKYELQTPVHYLYDNSQILGFAKSSKAEGNKTFRLVYISDYYENTIGINYKDFESDEIESIVDADGKSISFTREKENDCEILQVLDLQEKKSSLTFKDGNLTKLEFDDGRYAMFYYDNEGQITAVVGDNGLGVLFSYESGQVKTIKKFSLLADVTSGKLNLKNLEWNEENFLANVISDESVEIFYNDFKSTTLQTAKGKVKTYIFDEFGAVRSSYENKFDANQSSSVENCEFSYDEDRLSFKVEPLQRTQNFLEDVDFSKSSYSENSYYYLSDETLCNDFYPSLFYETTNYHELPAQKSSENFDEMEIDAENLARLKESEVNSLVLSGWACADSAFVANEHEDYGDIEFPNYIKNRKFELRAEITFKSGEEEAVASYKKSFDWMNTGWQLCSLYLPLEFEKEAEGTEPRVIHFAKNDIETIKFYFDYSHNTGNALYTELVLKEAKWQSSVYDKEARTVVQTSSHSPWKKTTYLDKDKQTQRVVISREVGEDEEVSVQEFETVYKYDKNHRLIKTIDHNGIVTENVFNDKGVQIKTLTYHKDEPTNVLYNEKLLDDKGVEIGQANEFGKQISTYERVSGSDNIKISKDNDGVQTAYGYNCSDECIEMSTTIDDTANVTTYGYEKDFLTSLKHNDFEITYDYDEQGRNNKIFIAGEEYLEKTFGQDEEATRLASNESFKTVYDEDGNVAEEYFNDTLAVQYSYDGYGNVLTTKEFFTDKNGKAHTTQHNFSYDKFGNTIYEEMSQHSDTDEWNFDIDTQFDTDGNVTSTTFTINGVVQEYEYAYSDDPDAKLEAVSLPNGAVQTLDYDKLSRVHKVELNVADGTLEHREYEYLKVGDHASNLVSKLKFARDGVQKEILRYKYDEKGNITEIRENNSLLARYKYDGLSRLIREDNKQFAKTTTFEYDAGGNILRRVEYAFTLAENLEEKDGEVFEYNYSLTGWRDQLKEYNGQAFEYDAIGNPTTYRDQTLTWSHGRRLDKFADIASYTYNANGIRTSKTFDNFTTKYFLNGNKILIQEDASNTLTFFYGADGVTGFHIKNSVIDADYYYKKNLQNDIIGIYDNQGTLIAKYEYDAWGNQKIKILQNFVKYVDLEEDFQYNDISDVNKFVAFKNPFRYRSYYYDFETNLYYLNSRYYDPELARFVNADDISNLDKESFNGLNLYAYCNNAPTINFDPNGDSLIALLFILLATTIAGAVANGVKAYNNGARGWDLFGEIVLGAAFGLAAGGAIISTIAVFAGALGFATVFGVGVAQAFAIGALAFNFTAFVIAPLFGIDMEGIEFEAPADSPSYKPPEYSYPTNALTLIKHNNLFNKRTIGNDLLFWRNIQYFKKIFGKN